VVGKAGLSLWLVGMGDWGERRDRVLAACHGAALLIGFDDDQGTRSAVAMFACLLVVVLGPVGAPHTRLPQPASPSAGRAA
jgi:hypothetical protein